MNPNPRQVRTNPDVANKPRCTWRAARDLILLALLGLTACGCATTTPPMTGAAVVPNKVRTEIGRLAVRSPNPPSISLTSDLDNKGEAAANTATSAGAAWLGGSMQAAGEAGEPITASVILALGLVTAPVVAAGGAVYGASAADTDEQIALGNATIERALDFAPEYFERSVEAAFGAAAPVPYEFVGTLDDEELAQRGFDTVLDLRMASITSTPSEGRFRAGFAMGTAVELRRLANGELLTFRTYQESLRPRAVSRWADGDGQVLMNELAASFDEIAGQIADQFFVTPPIRVQGLEPVSRRWFGTGTISGTMPMFVWAALDGKQAKPGPEVRYEIAIFPRGKPPERGVLTSRPRYVPPEALLACTRYRWKVRAHYDNFGESAQTNWTPEYRFKTPCGKPDSTPGVVASHEAVSAAPGG